MNIACIIIGIDGWEQYTLPLVESIQKHEPDCQIVVYDNFSDTRYPHNGVFVHWASFMLHPTARCCYSQAINTSASEARDFLGLHDEAIDWYIVLSNDVLCTGPFAHMLEALDAGTVAGPLLKEIDIPGVGAVHYIEGWCVAIPRAVWDALDGWDEGYQVSSYEDVDFSHRARRAGYYLEEVALPFVHLDQRQRFTIVPDYWSSEAYNRARFIEKHKPRDGYEGHSMITGFDDKAITRYEVSVNGVPLIIEDYTLSLTVPFVLRELATNQYGLNERIFADGSVILDIGANVGVVSIFLAKQLPNCTIYACEPLTINYDNLARNIELNGVENVIALPIAVTADGRNLMLHYNYDNLGGASGFMGQPPWNEFEVGTYTLSEVFEFIGTDRVALLKLDVEGAEHEILASANGELSRIDYLAMEAHFTPKLRRMGYNEGTLRRVLRPLMERNAVQLTVLESAA